MLKALQKHEAKLKTQLPSGVYQMNHSWFFARPMQKPLSPMRLDMDTAQ